MKVYIIVKPPWLESYQIIRYELTNSIIAGKAENFSKLISVPETCGFSLRALTLKCH
jgi:hypothetical protein